MGVVFGFGRKAQGAGDADEQSPAAAPDHSAQLQRLAELHDSGALSDAEFTAAKARILEQ